MALRCVLSKLGKISNSSHSYERLALGFTGASPPLPFRQHESCIPIPLTTHNKRQEYLVDLGGLRPARFALQEFNKLKKAQLHLVRVLKCVRVDSGDNCSWFHPKFCYCWYVLIFEAVDAEGLLKSYQASVRIHDLTEGLWLEDFCVFKVFNARGDTCRDPLYHHLDKFYDGLNSTDEGDVYLTDEECVTA